MPSQVQNTSSGAVAGGSSSAQNGAVAHRHDSRHRTANTSSHGSSSQKTHSSGPTVVGGHFKVGKKIGEGSFGIIYEGRDLKAPLDVAIKFEPRKAETPQLRDEYRTYKILAGQPGVPQCYYFGQEGLHSVLVIDLLGPSLEDVFDLCGREFSLKTVCMLAKRMIKLIQCVHENNLVYRDIKPDNFLIGRIPRYNEKVTDDPNVEDPYSILENHSVEKPSPASQIYIVDFGMVKQYRDPRTQVHIPFREKKSLSGTARYMSVNTHLGREQGRRDDMEALCHVFFYLLNSHLPWQGLKAASNRQKYERIGEVKQAVDIDELGRPNPPEFGQMLRYARGMAFEEQPNYDGMCQLIDQVMTREDIEDDGVFDWMDKLDEQRAHKREREVLRQSMTEEERREDDRIEREERIEKERIERNLQERRRMSYERAILEASPKMKAEMGLYFSTYRPVVPPPRTWAQHVENHKRIRLGLPPLTAEEFEGGSEKPKPNADAAAAAAAAGTAAAGDGATGAGAAGGTPLAGTSAAAVQSAAAIAAANPAAAAANPNAPSPIPHVPITSPAAVAPVKKKKAKWWKRLFSCMRH
ncbi:casein kinase I [Geranomyces michiganensis]|nr:casein kinase I [Geranomyces michiganensis]